MDKAKTLKIERCRYCFRYLGKNHDENHCVKNGWDNTRKVEEEDCETCESFDSRFIEYPLTVNDIENKKIDTKGLGHEIGCLCEISPCGEEYKGKSYIGFYLGDLPIGINSSFNRKTGVLTNDTMNNPAIFVPELKKIIYGCESWWREIESIDDFKGISKEEIENTWYVKLLKEFSE